MKNKIWAIGDIHGCYQELMALYNQLLKAGLNPEIDTVIFLGDYIDRGPDSDKVVGQLLEWHKKYKNFIFLYGNHEDIFRDFLTGCRVYGTSNWFVNGGKTTYQSYGGHFGREVDGEFEAPRTPEFPKEHLDFLFKETVYLYEEDDYIFVHGGLVPGTKTTEENLNFPNTLIWAREGFIESDFDWGKKVIFGHTADYQGKYGKPFEPIIMKNKIGIDTAVCPPASRKLTAIELPAEKFYFQESFSKRG